MNIQLNVENINGKNETPSYMVQVVVNGQQVKTQQYSDTSITKIPFSIRRWAIRFYNTEDITINLTETNWID